MKEGTGTLEKIRDISPGQVGEFRRTKKFRFGVRGMRRLS